MVLREKIRNSKVEFRNSLILKASLAWPLYPKIESGNRPQGLVILNMADLPPRVDFRVRAECLISEECSTTGFRIKNVYFQLSWDLYPEQKETSIERSILWSQH
jgi:hypothetical protein